MFPSSSSFRIMSSSSYWTILLWLWNTVNGANIDTDNKVIAEIVGGIEAPDGAYPAYAHTRRTYLCGGTLIHPDLVLSAGHCGTHTWTVGNTVYLGANHLAGTDALETHTVAETVIHPQFNDLYNAYDVMLVRLERSSDITPHVALAAADGSDDPDPDTPVTTIGFGTTSYQGRVSLPLLQVQVDVFDTDTCRRHYGCVSDDVNLCAGTVEGGKDSCQGDSGGPLFVQDGNPIQVGIVSHGQGCGTPNVPGVYTLVSGVRDWIDDTICEFSSVPPESCDRRRLEQQPRRWERYQQQGGLPKAALFFLCRRRCPF